MSSYTAIGLKYFSRLNTEAKACVALFDMTRRTILNDWIYIIYYQKLLKHNYKLHLLEGNLVILQ